MSAGPTHSNMATPVVTARSSFFQRYLLPGLVFQSIVIAGGYGTGREIAEFFLSEGPLGGLLAMMLVSTVIWSAVSAGAFEFARVLGAYDYRRFFTALLGRGWVVYEVGYLLLLVIVLGVIAATAGTILAERFQLSPVVGIGGIMAAIGLLVWHGSATIERALSGWSFVLYAVYAVLFVWSFGRFGSEILSALATAEAHDGWVVGGVRYAGYNVALIPAVLFTLRHVDTRREAIGAGLLTGPIAMMPALLFYLVMVGQYPGILDQVVPATALLDRLGSPGFALVFQIVLFGTLD